MSIFNIFKPKKYVLPADPSRIHTLHIGINAYERSPLALCVNDVISVKKRLLEWGVLEKNMVTLLDGDADTKNFKQALQDLVRRVQTGDYAVVQYSGHGSNLPCRREKDGNMEILCPVDIEKDFERNNVSDDFISDVIRQITEKSATFYALPFDCCHTGGMTRALAPSIVTRYLPAPDGARYQKRRESGLDDEAADTRNVVMLGGCEGNEVSYEYSQSNHGALTWAWLGATSKGLPIPRKLHSTVYKQVQKAFPGQHPVLEGNEALFDIPYFTVPK